MPTFLAQHQWKTKPFGFYAPSDIQLLISDAATLPSLLEAIDDLGSTPDENAVSKAEYIMTGLLEVHKSICKWKSLYEMNATCPWFPNIMAANIHTHTLSFEIICLTEMEKVDLFLADHGSTFTRVGGQILEIKYTDKAVWELAGKICQGVEYFLQEEMKLFGPASAVFPLRIAHDVLSRDCHGNQGDIRRCQGLIDRIRQRGISAIPYFPAKLADT